MVFAAIKNNFDKNVSLPDKSRRSCKMVRKGFKLVFVKPESFQESDLEICCMLVLDFW